MSVREDIADAASTVDGVSCVPYYRQTSKVGDGFVALGQMALAPDLTGFIKTWQVAINLPTEQAAAQKWIEAKSDALIEALWPLLQIRSLTPTQFVFDLTSPPVFGLVIEGPQKVSD